MEAQTIPAVARDAAERLGDKPALVEGGTTIGFAGLWVRAQRAASAFIGAGLVPGDRVAIWAPNSIAWIEACIGAQAAGGVVVPLNTRLKGHEAAFILGRSRARFLVVTEPFLGTDYARLLAGEDLPHLARTIATGAAWRAFTDVDIVQLPEIAPGTPCDIMFTSGTTGEPKGVVSSHAQTVRTFRIWCQRVGLREDDRYLIVNPFFHSFGYKAGWLACLIRGATIYPMRTLDLPTLAAMVAEHRITVLPGPPAIYQTMLASDLSGTDLSSLRLAVTGAASIPPVLIERMRRDLGIATVLTGYGLTESCGMVSMSEPHDPAELVARTCGTPIPGVEVRIDVGAADDEGEILVRGFNVMQGYFEDPVATAEAIDADGWLHTGDVGRFSDDRLVITDRIKDMYISGGFNCYPAEIERALERHPDVAQAAVIGVANERLGEVGRAYIVPAAGRALDPAQMLAWAKANMANYKAPHSLEIVASLPLNASGKVQKFALRGRFERGAALE